MKKIDMREYYNKYVSNIANQYEEERWFKTPLRKAGFLMTKQSIEQTLPEHTVATCLELGPGAGTWTEVILEKYPEITIDEVDISDAMLQLTQERFAGSNQLTYTRADFLEFTIDKQYDLFFSSRVIEYIPDKAAAFAKIISLLKPGGQAVIITKMPHKLRAKLHNSTKADIHSGQVHPREVAALLHEQDISDLAMYPAVIHVPFVNKIGVQLQAYNMLGQGGLTVLSQFVAESYIIRFTRV